MLQREKTIMKTEAKVKVKQKKGLIMLLVKCFDCGKVKRLRGTYQKVDINAVISKE